MEILNKYPGRKIRFAIKSYAVTSQKGFERKCCSILIKMKKYYLKPIQCRLILLKNLKSEQGFILFYLITHHGDM